MSRKTVNGKIAVMAVICSFLIAVHPVYAFVWPVIDLTEIVSFYKQHQYRAKPDYQRQKSVG